LKHWTESMTQQISCFRREAKKQFAHKWRYLLLFSCLGWILWAILSAANADSPTVLPERIINPANADYLHVGLTIPEFDPSEHFFTLTTTCLLSQHAMDKVADALPRSDNGTYDVNLKWDPRKVLPTFDWQLPQQDAGSTQHIRIFATGYQGDVIATGIQMAQGSQVTKDQPVEIWGDIRRYPFDTYRVVLDFDMTVPTGLEVQNTEFNPDPNCTMPCIFYVIQTEGRYHCTVQSLGNNELYLQFHSDRHFPVLAITIVSTAPILFLLLLSWPGRRRLDDQLRRFAPAIVLSFVVIGSRFLVVPNAAITVFTYYDRLLFAAAIVTLALLALLAGFNSRKKTRPPKNDETIP